MSQPARHRARKRFGQNFLTDHSIIDKIVTAIRPAPDDRLIEIGPGLGALTEPLLQLCPNLTVIELDRDLAQKLEGWQSRYPGLTIVQKDALKVDFEAFACGPHSLRIVGNLPYNISTPLLFHLISQSHLIQDMHFMLQKEVVERLAAGSGDPHYGRLGIMVQYHCEVVPLIDVPPHSFRPAPKVDSMVVRLTPHKTLPWPCQAPELLARLVNVCFQQRRKTLRNSLRHWLDAEQLEQLDIDLQARPETLHLSEFVALANRIDELGLGGSPS